MCELADEELGGVIATDVEPAEEELFLDIGYYIDDKGIKRYGIIPKLNTLKPRVEREFTNEIVNRNRTSDPRKYS